MTKANPTPEFSLEELARFLDVREETIPEGMRSRLAALLRTDPRLAEQLEQLEEMARDAGTEDLANALDQHQRFERWLAAEDLPGDVMTPEDYAELLRIAAARLARATPEERPKLLRVQTQLGRSYLQGLSMSLNGRDIPPEEVAAQLATFPPEVVMDFLRPFRRLLDQEQMGGAPA